MKIIAEIGTAHRGSLAKAEELIRTAAACGADIVKFQIVFAREILHPLTGHVPLPGGSTPLYEVFQSLERDDAFYRRLKELCNEAGVEFLATPFGFESAALLKKLDPLAVKIASPELNYTDLLEEVASWGIKVYLSSGVSREEDIAEGLSYFQEGQAVLFHCITSYPAPPEEYNLALLPRFKDQFGVETGVSDHSLDPQLVPSLACYYGASFLEKHFTLSREDDGLDDPIALEPDDFSSMTASLHELETLGRDMQKKELVRRFGEKKFQAVSGSGQKILAPSEKENYGRTNRSIHALRKLEAGCVLDRENCAVLRTEKVLRPGLHPRYFQQIQGRILKQTIAAGEGIRMQDLEDSSGLI